MDGLKISALKKIAHCTNNEEVYLTILRYHVHEVHLQYLLKLRADLCGEEDEPGPGDDPERIHNKDDHSKLAQRNDSISCDLGLRYPLLQSIFSGHKKPPNIAGNCLN